MRERMGVIVAEEMHLQNRGGSQPQRLLDASAVRQELISVDFRRRPVVRDSIGLVVHDGETAVFHDQRVDGATHDAPAILGVCHRKLAQDGSRGDQALTKSGAVKAPGQLLEIRSTIPVKVLQQRRIHGTVLQIHCGQVAMHGLADGECMFPGEPSRSFFPAATQGAGLQGVIQPRVLQTLHQPDVGRCGGQDRPRIDPLASARGRSWKGINFRTDHSRRVRGDLLEVRSPYRPLVGAVSAQEDQSLAGPGRGHVEQPSFFRQLVLACLGPGNGAADVAAIAQAQGNDLFAGGREQPLGLDAAFAVQRLSSAMVNLLCRPPARFARGVVRSLLWAAVCCRHIGRS